MSQIGVESNLPEVMQVLDENGVSYAVIPKEGISNRRLDEFDIVIVKEQSDVSKNSKDQTVIETKGIHASEVYEKIKYLV